MAKGETRYSSAGKPVHRFDNKPIPVDDYPLELAKEGLAVKKSESKGPDAIPYVNAWFKALGTENKEKEGAKPKIVFQKFFLSLKPGSDGVIMPERGGGIVEYARSFGEEVDFAVKTLVKSDDTEEQYFDSEEVLAYLQTKVGEVRNAHVGIEAAKDSSGAPIKGNPGQNKITHWNLEESVMTGEEAPKPTGKNNKPLPKRK